MQVLLLEPDRWRYFGLLQVLQADPELRILGVEDSIKVLALKESPRDLKPDVVIISHSLLIDFGLPTLDHLRGLFPKSNLLVDGYERMVDSIADILRAGAKGYFLLTAEPAKLLEALSVVNDGHIWAPRDAVALMADPVARSAADLISPTEAAILKALEDGLGNKEIARRLDLAPVTVKAHLTKLYRRLGVKTRLELLAYAVTHRLLRD